MIQWAFINTHKINRVGYNKEVKTLLIDFIGSELDTAYIKVPSSLFESFIEAKSPDYFFEQFIDGYFEVAELPK